MNVFIALLFVCVNDTCMFLASDTKHFKQSECMKEMQQAVRAVRDTGQVAHGTCVKVSTKDLV